MKKKTSEKKPIAMNNEEIKEMIIAGFRLYVSIKGANWDYNNGRGLPHPTPNMNNACDEWIRCMERNETVIDPAELYGS